MATTERPENLQEPTDSQVQKSEERPPGLLTDEDIEKTAKDYAEYLVVNSQQEKQQLDQRIQSIVFRVEEFQRQLDWMHQNVTSTSEKLTELHVYTRNLTDLFDKIDQIEEFVGIVNTQVNQLEQVVSKAERDLEPNKIRKVFSVIPGIRKPQSKGANEPWIPPELFSCKDYFSPSLRSIEPTEPSSVTTE